MKNYIIVVANDLSVASSFMQSINSSEYSVARAYARTEDDEEINENSKEFVFSAWNTLTNGEKQVSWINERNVRSAFNMMAMPYAGIGYLVAKDRFENNTDARYAILSIRETYRTTIAAKQLYHAYVDSKFQPNFTILKEILDNETENPLFHSDFDFVQQDALDLKIPLMCSSVSKYDNR